MGASERGKPPNALRAKEVEKEEEEEEVLISLISYTHRIVITRHV
jgi:hypothetical protein